MTMPKSLSPYNKALPEATGRTPYTKPDPEHVNKDNAVLHYASTYRLI